jgi:hypothetical protein
MMRKFAFIALLALAGCKKEPSLQRYFVDKSEDTRFMELDLSPTILDIDSKQLTGEEQRRSNPSKS